MTAEDLWKMFCEKESLPFETKFDAWQFGGAPDYLAALVMQRIKTATASGYDLYFIPGAEEKLPQTGDYSVIEDSKGQAVCVIQTTKTVVIAFDKVSYEHAYKEGEGDRSLTYWRKVHKEFFEEDFASCGVKFDFTSKILCEEFELVYSLYEVLPFLEADAKDICKWTYEDNYAVYNYPSWDECVNMQISFTNEETRREQYYKVLKAGERMGYFRLEKSDNTIELSVGIAPDKCSGGNGDMLINLALAKISELYPGKKIILTVRPFNKRAIRVYEKAGFKIVKEYYEDRYLVPGPMLLMEMISR